MVNARMTLTQQVNIKVRLNAPCTKGRLIHSCKCVEMTKQTKDAVNGSFCLSSFYSSSRGCFNLFNEVKKNWLPFGCYIFYQSSMTIKLANLIKAIFKCADQSQHSLKCSLKLGKSGKCMQQKGSSLYLICPVAEFEPTTLQLRPFSNHLSLSGALTYAGSLRELLKFSLVGSGQVRLPRKNLVQY